ncbi:type VI secretion system membrane subunit TssM [Nitrogeniibacter mangrovi]|uniref:Type VI secretion system membrane subunit TssM n=1 Tax=Nitrogeniibacter mangrovi TaxID=2016596 RepID=A0A6C1B381_9RHOO|nr:type VI secretion system membrane subunit TssM [Nitrogeniibacter mangrovi]QID18112.1 type VI secretion system membrane subunit TssM [Nitrogeniibacter mangrovi]
MSRLRSLLLDSRTLSFLGIAALIGFFFLGASTLKLALTWAAIASVVILLIWLAVWLWRRRKARKAAAELDQMLDEQAEQAARAAPDDGTRAEIETLRERMREAVRTIKTSKLGQLSGNAALYELPWYIVIGNPAAGKSTAVVNSGLRFPFADGASNVIHGIGGTRNCDWFFTSEGILLDTAGRYSVHEEDRGEWLGFLDLLKRHRRMAPINGIIVAVSIAELVGNRPEFAVELAKNLRQRVQELTERLEVFAPVYVMFTKADLITGFNDFFQDVDWNERDRVWGATLPYQTDEPNDAIARFDRHFDALYDGLREMSVAQMSLARGNTMPPGLLAFPLEFAAIKPALRGFLATLFEDNPFQYKPVFRGFYFTSAVQDGESKSASTQRVEERFGLVGDGPAPTRITSSNGFFLKDLFSRVVFADRNLVRQHASRRKTRLRHAGFAAALVLLGLALAGWSWSFVSNQSLVANVRADLDKAVRLQADRIDLQSRLEALDILQDRITQLEGFETDHPLSLGLGLFQGDALLTKLKAEYFAGVRSIMLTPVVDNLEAFLREVNAHADALQPVNQTPATTGTRKRTYERASATNVEDAYNALKTYLMLSSRSHVEAGHLSDQLTRFWRGWLESNRGTMSREQMIRSAERILSFHLSQANDPQWPLVEINPALVDQTRENLRRVVQGMPAVERVYADIKARAATRFSPVTVASVLDERDTRLVTGARAISGAFTEAAWKSYVRDAIKEAATNELQSTDWVLNTSVQDDLTLQGSPEQIQKTLTAMYKKDYAAEWQAFAAGISVTGFDAFDAAVAGMNRLGDPQDSPLQRILKTLYAQTAWDNPAAVNRGLAKAQTGFVDWFKRSILRMQPSRVQVDLNVSSDKAAVAMGPIGERFSGVGRIVAERDGAEPLVTVYLKQLSKLRTRLNQLKNQGDPGPGAIALMRQTLEGNGSELADTLRFVDEQMLAGVPDTQRKILRPLLVRPLLQTYAAIIRPAERELNKTWLAQVFDPYQHKLAIKYPFAPNAEIEASPTEIAQIFGPEGAIAKFVEQTMGPVVVRRGNTIVARTWGDLGITITPEFMRGVARWVAPLDGGAAGGTGAPQTVFQLMPHPAPGTTEFMVEIDGQQLRYRNTAAQWANFVWPNAQGTPGARIVATTFDGRSVEVVNFPGRYGLEKLINSARRQRKPEGTFQLAWEKAGVTVKVDLRIISSAQAQAASQDNPRERIDTLALPRTVAGTPAAPGPVAQAQPGATP